MIDQEEWCEIEDFPGYEVSSLGRVIYLPTGHIKAASINQQGIPNVILSQGHYTTRRSVPLLVALAFVPGRTDNLDTPIHLDGVRLNCEAENLAWRPRWFAVKYHQQFNEGYRPALTRPIVDMDTGREYVNSMDAAVQHGLLDNEVLLAILNNTAVWPTFQRFRQLDW